MKTLLDFLTANAPLLCFGAAAILSMVLAVAAAWTNGKRRGWEECSRVFAQHAFEQARHQHSERI